MWVRLSQNYLWFKSGIYTIPCDYTTSYKRLFVYILTHYSTDKHKKRYFQLYAVLGVYLFFAN